MSLKQLSSGGFESSKWRGKYDVARRFVIYAGGDAAKLIKKVHAVLTWRKRIVSPEEQGRFVNFDRPLVDACSLLLLIIIGDP